MRRTFGTIATLVALAGVAACGGEGAADAGDRQARLDAGRFVEVMAQLREAEQGLDPDSAEDQFEARKREVLDRHGVTEADLRAFVERNHGRFGLMVAVWDSIGHRLRPDAAEPAADTLRGRPPSSPASDAEPDLEPIRSELLMERLH